jgi:hypothetical protein
VCPLGEGIFFLFLLPGVADTGDNLPPASVTLVENLLPVSPLNLGKDVNAVVVYVSGVP